MNDISLFAEERNGSIERMAKSDDLKSLSLAWVNKIGEHRYTYNFDALGLPIIQLPQDIVAIQEIIWKVRPDLVIETGIARGGSLVHNASILAMLDYADAVAAGTLLDPAKSHRKVLGIDIDIRPHNRAAIEGHAMSSRIEMMQGSAIDEELVAAVAARAAKAERVLVILDSNHTHDHVLRELELYAPLVSPESYCIVMDTLVEDLDDGLFPDRPWGKGDNPKTAVWEYLKTHPEFEIDHAIHEKLLLTVAPDGYLRRVR